MIDLIKKWADEMQLFRMIGWLGMGLLFCGGSILVGNEHPQIQLALWKLGLVTLFAFVGYWIARRSIGRLKVQMDGHYNQSEAIIIAGSILARAFLIGFVVMASNGL